ncbi:MAG: ABC transporter permease [Bacteroidaceae bacterium]|nr:ABC transporter permease [Bacteroidaceae bacterium]
MKLVWKLLRRHISIPQLLGFVLANLAGMTIIMLGLQFYTDVKAVYQSEDSFMKSTYIIVNKPVSTLSSLTGRSGAFSQGEIQDLESQSFCTRVGAFIASDFDVKATFSLDNTTSFSTEMFFEAVPDEFVDVDAADWNYSDGSDEVPIILPRNYLDLYNFGFAQSRSLPRLSEGILSAIRLGIDISSPTQGTKHYYGRIVGFSNRLNTILVPWQFMQWANQTYAASKQQQPTRLIFEVDNPTDERINTYIADQGYETDSDKLDASKTTYLLRIIVGIVMAVGAVICILSFYILMLSVYLLVEKNSTKLENLLLIGYSPKRVAMPYQLLTVGLNTAVLIVAFILLIVVRAKYLELFSTFFPDFDTPPVTISVVVGVALLVLASIFNICVIYSKVKTIWKRKD